MDNSILDILRNLPKPPPPQNYMVHIDDLLYTLRKLRKDGCQIQRGRDVFGKRNATFLIYAGQPYYLATLFVDTTRSLKRGRFYIMPNTDNMLAVYQPIQVEFEHKPSDWWIGRYRFDTDWKIGSDPFNTTPMP